VPVATCTASGATAGNNYTTTTCATTIVSGPTVVASCTPVAASAANSYQATTCGTTNGNNPVATCVPSGPTAANNYTTTTCGTTTTTNIPVATCTPSGPTAANNYTTTTCSTNNTTNVPVATCTASGPTLANNYTTTTCPAPVTSGPTAVATCTPVAASSGNNWVATTCTVGTTGPTPVASCAAVSPTAANSYTTTSCGTVVTTNVPIATCTPAGPTSTNSYVTTTCSTNNTTSVPVASCTAAAPSSTNNYTRTTCANNNTTNVAVATCTASSPTSANGYTTTTCSTAVTPAVGVASCTPIAASSANNYTTTSCGTNNTNNVPVASCTPAGPTSANGFTTTTCPTPATTGPTPIATCTPQAATSANNWVTTTCPAPITTTGVAVSSCTPATASSTNNYTTTTCAAHNTGPTAVASCTPAAATSANNWTATTCSTTPVSTATASCTASGPTAANNYTTTTCSANNTSNVPVATCTAGSADSSNAYTTTTCSAVTTGPTLQPSCTPDPATAANNYTATTCTAAPGTQITYSTRKTITTTLMNGNIAVGVPTVQVSDTGPFTATQCFSPVATPPALPTSPSPSGVIASLGLTLGPVPPATCSQWPCTTSAVNPPTGSINSLADVAQYYYVTNLRPDLAANMVKPVLDKPAVESDDATWPHMTTFAVGLGVAGTLTFDPNYRDVSTMTKDFADIRTGVKAWPLWPDPAIKYDPLTGGSFDNWNDPRAIDDFWHAAVNGRGQYFSAKDPTAVVAGLTAALGKIEITTGTGAGAATSSQAPVAGDNSAFVASYQTATWSGEVEARPIDLSTGAVNLDPTVPPTWSAQTMLAKKTGQSCDNRLIYLFDASATNNMVEFTWNTSSCDGSGAPIGTPRTGLSSAEMAYFGSAQVQLLSQYASMTDGTLGTVDQRTAAVGSNLVNFIRGQRGLEKFSSNDLSKLYRSRVSALGDFIDSQPVYVKGPSLLYQDAGYSDFVSAQAGRTPMVYVGGNDGMLHAFYAGTSATDPLGGQEAWAMIPSSVLPNLYKLADANYSNTHQYFVDGTPTVGDISDASGASWKTMLVGGLNSGGKGYYAIDVTDPLNPKAMWEFKSSGTCYDGTVGTAASDCFIGYTYGQPIITKIADPSITTGRWVVIVTSGYNNVHASPTTGDGIGYLYVLDAATGKILYRISTGVGSAATPSGLAQISGYATNASIDNTAAWVYGGDLLGNIWRFDVNNAITPAGRDATLLGQAKDPSSNPQPITVRPELGELNGLPMVFVGTGRFLGATDVTNTQIQSVYGIVDTLSGNDPVYADLRTALKPLVMTQTGSGSSAVRTIACSGSAAECTLTSGWRIDLDAALTANSNEVGERVNVPLSLVQGTLIFASNVPSGTNAACEANGHGWLNYVNFSTGFAVGSTASSTTGQAVGGVRVSDFVDGGLITGFTPIYLPSTGKYRIVGITSGKGSFNPPPPIQPPPTSPGRISWREIAQ
jgi:type IV pilus assembly protein PilY1